MVSKAKKKINVGAHVQEANLASIRFIDVFRDSVEQTEGQEFHP